MLSLQPITSPRDSRTALEKFDPANSTWLVSDLKSKLDLNRKLLRETSFVPGDAVLRANELWRMLLTRVRPDLQIVSREFALTLIADRVSKFELPWAQAPGAAQTVFEYMTQLMPILAHPNGQEMMTDWFARHESSQARWGRWFELATRVWDLFLEEGFLAPAWASGVLVNETGLAQVWSRPLVVDLGADLNQVEADLLHMLADHIDVLILRPDPAWASDYKKSLVAYEVLEAKVGIKRLTPFGSSKSLTPEIAYRKYTTMIAEVKDATAQVRKWLDDGVKPADIVIAAPDIEPYWGSLSNYLDLEGVPTQKDRVRRLHSYPDIAQWMANLRLRTGNHDESDMELALYANRNGEPRLIPYEKFKTLYSAVYGREDLDRAKEVADAFQIELEANGSAIRDDFIAWTLKQLPASTNYDRVETAYKKIFTECPESLELPVKRWMAYLEQVVSKTETRVVDGVPDGISCVRLSSAENSPAKKMILLGLTESALKKTLGTAILFSDLWSLAQEFGFQLASEDQAQAEFEARWIIESGERDLILSVPETDFNGAAQAPSWLWIKGAREAGSEKQITIPAATRWDEIQLGQIPAVAKERAWKPAELELIQQSISEDFNERQIENYAAGVIKKLSPSRIEDYLECPFIFASKHLFALTDDAELDLEVDHSRRGSLMHAVFEGLTTEPMRFDYSEAELDAVVETARVKARIDRLADERLWQPLKTRHIDLARRFLAFEKEYREKFPDATTAQREYSIAGFLRPATGELLPYNEPEEGALTFTGRIDRIDQDQEGHLAVFDYKSSDSSAKQFGSWIKNNKIQLLLYALAIENGLTELEPRPVLAALYYVARPLSRDTGFMVEDAEQGLYKILDKRKRNRVSAETKETLFRDAENLVKTAVSGMAEGRYAALPRDPKNCKDCKWSPLCRTPHQHI